MCYICRIKKYGSMEQIDISLGDKVISRVFVEDGVDALEACIGSYPHVFAVMDANVAMNCPVASRIAEIMNRRNVPGKLIEASEETKTMDTVMEICGWLLENGADRDALVLAIGGGITTDMVGFAASIYKRGVRFAYVPTTLLAQVDAAIGGKTGVNFAGFKNMLGLIRQPEFTYMCPQVLESLPMADFQSGASELMKTFVIEDNGNYRKALSLLQGLAADFMELCSDEEVYSYRVERWPEVLVKRMNELTPLIAAAARVKAGVVTRDQFEKGERRKLNLGHTFAHAIESLARKDHNEIDHGHAVAVGMVYAARLSEGLGMAEEGFAAALEKDLESCLLLVINPYGVEDMADAMRKDKKAEGGKVHFVLPRAVGDVITCGLSVDEVVELLKI